MKRAAESGIVGGGVREFNFDNPFFSNVHLSLLARLDAGIDHVLETVDVRLGGRLLVDVVLCLVTLPLNRFVIQD